jgi:diketogulonate reductase-like aldo/keto reductase
MEHRVMLPTGEPVPALGQGTWRMGERRERREKEIAALRLGIELGMTLIDTAEMYGEGRTEELVGEAIRGLRELARLPGGAAFATNQILYNVARRGAAWDLIPWLFERHIPSMAYSPIEQGSLPHSRALTAIARRHGATPFQVALAWVLRRDGVIAIPKASNPEHVCENRKALDLTLDETDLQAIDEEFPPHTRRTPLEMT